MRKNKVKAIVLRVIFISGFLALFIYMFGKELRVTTPFLNTRAAFNGVIPSAAVIVSNISWFFVNKFPSKQKFAKWSVITFFIAYIFGVACGFVHYEVPLILEAFNFYVYQWGMGMILSVLFGIVIYLLSKVYFSLIKG